MLMCRWMCEASLHVYRRSGAVAHEANFWAATRADVSNIQAANVPNVVMDQGMADVADFCSRQCAADKAAYVEAQGAAPRGASGAATRGAGGAANTPPPTREAAPSAPIDARSITAENATDRSSSQAPSGRSTHARSSVEPAGRRPCCDAPSTPQSYGSRLPRRAMADHTRTRASRSTNCGRCLRDN